MALRLSDEALRLQRAVGRAAAQVWERPREQALLIGRDYVVGLCYRGIERDNILSHQTRLHGSGFRSTRRDWDVHRHASTARNSARSGDRPSNVLSDDLMERRTPAA